MVCEENADGRTGLGVTSSDCLVVPEVADVDGW